MTDYIDGEIARRYSLITDFRQAHGPARGQDHDGGGVSFAWSRCEAIPAWVAIVVIAREFLITGLRLLAVSKGRVLAADPIGKHKTSWQIATVIFFLVLLSFQEFVHSPLSGNTDRHWRELWTYGGWIVSGIAVVLTIYSGLDYLWRHRTMISTD